MNILIKLTCLIGLVVAPILGDGHAQNEAEDQTEIHNSVNDAENQESKEVMVSVEVNQSDSSATSEINTVVVENGDTITNSSETVEGQVSVDSVVNASI